MQHSSADGNKVLFGSQSTRLVQTIRWITMTFFTDIHCPQTVKHECIMRTEYKTWHTFSTMKVAQQHMSKMFTGELAVMRYCSYILQSHFTAQYTHELDKIKISYGSSKHTQWIKF